MGEGRGTGRALPKIDSLPPYPYLVAVVLWCSVLWSIENNNGCNGGHYLIGVLCECIESQ